MYQNVSMHIRKMCRVTDPLLGNRFYTLRSRKITRNPDCLNPFKHLEDFLEMKLAYALPIERGIPFNIAISGTDPHTK